MVAISKSPILASYNNLGVLNKRKHTIVELNFAHLGVRHHMIPIPIITSIHTVFLQIELFQKFHLSNNGSPACGAPGAISF